MALKRAAKKAVKGAVRFIRKGGRVIPIKAKGGASAAKKQGRQNLNLGSVLESGKSAGRVRATTKKGISRKAKVGTAAAGGAAGAAAGAAYASKKRKKNR